MKYSYRVLITAIITFTLISCTNNKEKDALINGGKTIKAIKMDDTAMLDEVLKLNCNLHISDNLNPLYNAAHYNSISCFKQLLKIDSIASDSLKRVLAVLAVNNDQFEIFNMLLESGVDINMKDEDGIFLINYALQKDSLKFYNKLREKGAAISQNNEKGKSNLFYAIAFNHKTLFDEFIDSCDLYNSDYSVSPANIAIEKNNINLFKQIYNKDSRVRSDKNSLLGYAAQYGNIEIVKFLLKDKANPNASYFYSVTNFDKALSNGNKEIIDAMIKSGAKKTKSEIRKSGSSLLSAVENNNLEAIKYYIRNGLSANDNSAFSGPPLRLALQERALKSVELLIKLGARPEMSAMEHLFACNNLDIVKKVMANGGAGLLNGKDQKKIMTSLLAHGSKDIIQYVLPKINKKFKWKDNEDTRSAFYFSSYHNSILGMKNIYKDVKIHPDSACFFDNSPLEASCIYASFETMEFCIEKGGDVNKLDDEGESPLIDVINSGNHDDVDAKYRCVKLLLDNNANVNIGDTRDKETPIMIAARYGYDKIIELLLDNGADIFLKDDDGDDIISYLGRNKISNDLFKKILSNYLSENKIIPDEKMKYLVGRIKDEKHYEMLSVLAELTSDSSLHFNGSVNGIDSLDPIEKLINSGSDIPDNLIAAKIISLFKDDDFKSVHKYYSLLKDKKGFLKNNIYIFLESDRASLRIEGKLEMVKEIVEKDPSFISYCDLEKKLNEYDPDYGYFIPLATLKYFKDKSVPVSNNTIKQALNISIDIPQRNLDVEAFVYFWENSKIDKTTYINQVLEDGNATILNILRILGEKVDKGNIEGEDSDTPAS